MRINYKKYGFIKRILIASAISIFIGTLFLLIGAQTWKIPFERYLWNAGYSVSLGLALFSNGFFFHFVERKYISWVHRPVKSVLIAIAIHLSYSTIVIIFINWLWFILIEKQTVNEFLSYGWFIIIGEYIVLIIVTSIIYARSFFHEYREEAIQGERLKQEAIELQYQVMQNQVNPHFLFNSLNVLGSLIDVDKEKAKTFTRELSIFYRDVLRFKDKEIVALKDEIDFLQRYIYLQKIRFGDNFDVEFYLKQDIPGNVIAMSVQMMIENAVKHNIISHDKPLKIVVAQNDENELFVENNLQPKASVSGSNNIGLQNLNERYRFLTGKGLTITKNDLFFRVSIPLISI
ncbi:MAG: histidine kinase [Prolixibacteraceae bacterium]|nr:histidine kinase [Prolixibacteraceae bacterium]